MPPTSNACRIYVYTLARDTGFAPNPFHAYCTLACCMQNFRPNVVAGDLVLGITPVSLGHKLAYAMEVSETPSPAEYFNDRRFSRKKPIWQHGRSHLEKCGDNCYEPLAPGKFRQLPSSHYDNTRDREDLAHKEKDIRGRKVLVARRFAYYGSNPKDVPGHLAFMMPGRFYRVRFSPRERDDISAFVATLDFTARHRPREWPESDESWRGGWG